MLARAALCCVLITAIAHAQSPAQQRQDELARELKRQNELIKRQGEETARLLRKLDAANRPKDTSFKALPPAPDESWVDDKYRKAYANAWFYFCQKYPLLGGQTFVRGFFEALLERDQQDPAFAVTTVDPAWLRKRGEAFVKEWGVPSGDEVKPDSAKYRDCAKNGTSAMRSYIAKARAGN